MEGVGDVAGVGQGLVVETGLDRMEVLHQRIREQILIIIMTIIIQ